MRLFLSVALNSPVLLIWAACIGFNIAMIFTYVFKKVQGEFISKLLEKEATNKEKALSLEELGYSSDKVKGKILSFLLRDGASMRRLIRTDKDPVVDEKSDNMESAEATKENSNTSDRENEAVLGKEKENSVNEKPANLVDNDGVDAIKGADESSDDGEAESSSFEESNNVDAIKGADESSDDGEAESSSFEDSNNVVAIKGANESSDDGEAESSSFEDSNNVVAIKGADEPSDDGEAARSSFEESNNVVAIKGADESSDDGEAESGDLGKSKGDDDHKEEAGRMVDEEGKIDEKSTKRMGGKPLDFCETKLYLSEKDLSKAKSFEMGVLKWYFLPIYAILSVIIAEGIILLLPFMSR